MDQVLSPKVWSVLEEKAKTLAKETVVDQWSVLKDIKSELSAGDMDVPKKVTQEFILELLIIMIGLYNMLISK